MANQMTRARMRWCGLGARIVDIQDGSIINKVGRLAYLIAQRWRKSSLWCFAYEFHFTNLKGSSPLWLLITFASQLWCWNLKWESLWLSWSDEATQVMIQQDNFHSELKALTTWPHTLCLSCRKCCQCGSTMACSIRCMLNCSILYCMTSTLSWVCNNSYVTCGTFTSKKQMNQHQSDHNTSSMATSPNLCQLKMWMNLPHVTKL